MKVRSNGRIAKSWSQRLRIAGVPFNLGLGTYPIVSLSQAREAALENARAVRRGEDPRRQREQEVVITFEMAATEAHRLHAPSWRNPKSARLWIASMERHVYPAIGSTPVAEVTTGDLLAILAPHQGTETLRKLKQRIGTVMKHTIAQGWRVDDPSGAALAAALPKNSTAPTKHHRSLPHTEVGDAIEKIRASRAWQSTKLALEFTILTAARSGEVRGAIWDEVDLRARTWTVAAERTRTGRPFRVAPSERACNILGEARQLSEADGLVFPTERGRNC